MSDYFRAAISGLQYRQADVFSRSPLAGNGLAVFPDASRLDGAVMQALTQELRQFESIFLTATDDPAVYRARMFTEEEELDFAGHPILGAAAVLHDQTGDVDERDWTLKLNAKDATVTTRRRENWYEAWMDQGAPEFCDPLSENEARQFLEAMNLRPEDLEPGLPVQTVSTGLPYLMVPLRSGLDNLNITHPEFEAMLATVGAKFSYPLDIATREGRSFDNRGILEDVATGSAAGPAAAYLMHHGQAAPGETVIIRQGRFVGRPSEILTRTEGAERVFVGGDVAMVAKGVFD